MSVAAFDMFVTVFFLLIPLLVIFLATRWFWTWYFKINRLVALLEAQEAQNARIIVLLERMAGQDAELPNEPE